MELVQSKLGKVAFARLVEDEDLLETINLAAKKSQINVGFFILIGTLKRANLGFYRAGKYETIEIDSPLEIVSCLGNVSLKKGEPFAHAHISVSDEKGKVLGGHVMHGCIIAATGELILVEATEMKLYRVKDEKTGLFLWSFGK